MTATDRTPEELAAEASQLLQGLLRMQRGSGPNHGLTLPELFLLNRVQRVRLEQSVQGLDGREITRVVMLAGARWHEQSELRVYFFIPEDVVRLAAKWLDHLGRDEHRMTPMAMYVSPLAYTDVPGDRRDDRAMLARMADVLSVPRRGGDRR